MIVQAMQKYSFLFKTLVSSFGIVYLLNPNFNSPTVACLFIFCALYFLFQSHSTVGTVYTQSRYISAILSLFVILGERWLDLFVENRSIQGAIYLITASVGLYILFEHLLNILYTYFEKKRTTSFNNCKTTIHSSKQVFLTSFCMLWFVYFLFYLNQYPGSLSCDTPSQLAQAMGDQPFENANPLINTLVLTLFVRIGLCLGHSVNSGIALYTFFQFSLSALIFAYTVTVLYKVGTNKWVLLLSQLFFNFVPYNIIYANGMWKDTFFAILFLATLAYIFIYIYIYIYIFMGIRKNMHHLQAYSERLFFLS